MTTLQPRTEALQMTPQGIGRLATGSGLVLLLSAVAVLLPSAASSQSLDNAVQSQLEIVSFVPCAALRDGQPNPAQYLSGPLLGICTRGGGQTGATPSVAAGGGAATPASLPAIIQQRLRERQQQEEQKKKKPPPKATGASADAAVYGAGRRGFFISAEAEALDREVTAFEDGYDSDIRRLVVGMDFQPSARSVVGFAFDASQHDGDFDGGGDFEVSSYGLVGFGSFLPSNKSYVQYYASLGRDGYDRNRFALFSDLDPNGNAVDPPTAVGLPHAEYDADRYGAGILAGLALPVGNATISPFAGLEWQDTGFDTYSETGGPSGLSGLELTFHDDKRTMLPASVGVQVSATWGSGSWVVVPQASATLKHELDDDQRVVEVSFVGDQRANRFTHETEEPDRDWVVVRAGISAIGPNGLELFGYYGTVTGHAFLDSSTVTVGLRFQR